jgi:hypothetical protein
MNKKLPDEYLTDIQKKIINYINKGFSIKHKLDNIWIIYTDTNYLEFDFKEDLDPLFDFGILHNIVTNGELYFPIINENAKPYLTNIIL